MDGYYQLYYSYFSAWVERNSSEFNGVKKVYEHIKLDVYRKLVIALVSPKFITCGVNWDN